MNWLRDARLFGCLGVVALAAPCLAQALSTGTYRPKLPAQSPPLRVEVIDGTRFRDIETKTVFRLYGIETCAPGQMATLGRQPWPCGTMATAWLVTATLNRWLACAVIREDGDERLARCATASHPDLAASMLREGVAVLAPAAAEDQTNPPSYGQAEQQARKAYRGLWSSTFEMPWDWRAHRSSAAPAAPGEAAP
ncbi:MULTISPECIES: thermonuclease family protein [Bosea]|uniref:Thermonuclease family protein n=1 Tax=Bosea spartocytisi TaxID=2773451 RepID=A0A927I3F9_9HYPH|nr:MULTISPECIES: thermonuclease family protein [Bosea]MBD3849148.1 thermonuclease family protein [Bosea spartocytisi]MCP4559255.1 nuclease [Bosea sp. (in: a-proteobacteria)]MCP4739319.1 nuclease [Bosea sp. (in: a-proteobacteria)]MCT4475436.1 thermonuclease family protein [Bosea spartocytisi]